MGSKYNRFPFGFAGDFNPLDKNGVTPEHLTVLKEKAKRFRAAQHELLGAGSGELPGTRAEGFRCVLERVLNRNANLYRWLAKV